MWLNGGGTDILTIRTRLNSEVRRSALFNIEQSKETLPLILERARDIDPYNRRSVFAKPMEELSDFRKLSIEDREKLLRYGLSDRLVLRLKGLLVY